TQLGPWNHFPQTHSRLSAPEARPPERSRAWGPRERRRWGVRGAEAPRPRLDRWEVIGPGGGGTMTHPTISPHDPNVVLVGCDMTGAYITHDGGESWRMFNLGTVVSSFALDPEPPDVIYAGSPALLRSARRER